MKQLKEIPTTVIMGFLGAGKSTAVTQLLTQKPTHEKWLVLVNEFGKIAVDQLLIQGDQNSLIKEIGGGCICCSANMLLKTTLTTSIRTFRPDRVIIEPTGLAHPRKIMQMLINDFNGVLDILSVATIIDPLQFTNEKYLTHQSYLDQLTIADLMICNKTDLADDKQIVEVEHWSKKHNKPLYNVSFGEIKLHWLIKSHRNMDVPKSPHHEQKHTVQQAEKIDPSKGELTLYEGSGLGYYSYGILFSKSDTIDEQKIFQFVDSLNGIMRIKGVIQTDCGTRAINVSGGSPCSASATKSDENCLELITECEIDKTSLLNGIKKTLINS